MNFTKFKTKKAASIWLLQQAQNISELLYRFPDQEAKFSSYALRKHLVKLHGWNIELQQTLNWSLKVWSIGRESAFKAMQEDLKSVERIIKFK